LEFKQGSAKIKSNKIITSNLFDFLRNYCFCGDSYGLYGKGNETDCNSNCGGNPSQICGGGWRNSVYEIVP